MNCKICGKKLKGFTVMVARDNLDTGEKEIHYIHVKCFSDSIKSFTQEIINEVGEFKLEENERDDMEFQESPRSAEVEAKPKESKEKQIERHKNDAMVDIEKAQIEKEGLTWLCLVNDPSSYYAVRQMLSLKGIDMRVEQFEELAAVFIQLTRKAMLKAAMRTSQMPLNEAKKSV